VVAISYLVMLGYITLALAALPPPSQILHVFVLSRAGGGVHRHALRVHTSKYVGKKFDLFVGTYVVFN